MITEDGYQIGSDYAAAYTITLNTPDELYCISSTEKASRCWLASPSAYSASSMYGVYSDEQVSNADFYTYYRIPTNSMLKS